MIKPSQKLIDLCLTISQDDRFDKKNINILKQQLESLGLLDDIDFSDSELIEAISDFTVAKRLDNMDLSDIKLPYREYMDGKIQKQQPFIESWTDNMKWPSGISFNPQQMLEQSKHPSEMDTVHQYSTGKDIGIAIIDQPLNIHHPEYADNIRYYEKVGFWPKNYKGPAYHGSLVTGCACGTTTGTAPDADIYYIAANNWTPDHKDPFVQATEKLLDEPLKMGHRYNHILAIKRILEINKTLPENKKIRFLSCSWGEENDQLRKECDKLFDECEHNGIMVIGGFYNIEKNKTRKMDKRFTNSTSFVGIPTDGKTTPYYKGGYVYKRSGGASSTYPYLAGVFACACQGNQVFFTRTDWQNELWDILKNTAIESEHGGKMINPTGIRERVTQIAREMELQIAKQNGTQHE